MHLPVQDLSILICDDSVTNTMILAKLLESEGYTQIRVLNDPTKVLPLMEEELFDLLLLDIEMPDLDGFEIMDLIHKSSVGRQQVPILVLTGRQDQETRLKALDSGAQDFLNKPIDQAEVVLRVKNPLRGRASFFI